MLAGVVAADGGNVVTRHLTMSTYHHINTHHTLIIVSNTDLGSSEVVSGAGPGGGGRGKAGVHKVQPDPANVGVSLVQGVLARGSRVVGVWETFDNINSLV